MKIALLDGFPNLPNSAEAEFIRRFEIACGNLGYVEAKEASCSKEIYEFEPDLVLASHESLRKLTRFPTIGMMWSPLSFFEDNDYRITSIKSYDGYIAANQNIANFCRDIQFGTPNKKPIGDEYFLPTTYKTEFVAVRDVEEPSLIYMGVHWDGGRHRKVFDLLAEKDFVTFYGPARSWDRHSNRYGGMIPFDGRSVQSTLNKHGIALCFHKREHRIENTPSMRIFEALSVGAIPICDEIEFAQTHLADIALFVDTTRSPERIVAQIEEHVTWVRKNREEATRRALKGKAWFDKHWSLEAKIENCIIPAYKEVLVAGRFPQSARAAEKPSKKKTAKPVCEIVVRAGGRPVETLSRAIDSIIAASTPEYPLGVILVDYKGRKDIRRYIEDVVAKSIAAKYVRCEDTGCRSTSMWAGMKAVTAPYTAHLDDDDTVYPNHYAQLIDILEGLPSTPMAYSGCVRKEDSQGLYFKSPNFDGPLNREIEEDRELCFFSPFDLSRLTHFDNYITSNSWVARTSILQSNIGDDPRLEVAEDIFILFLLAQHGQPQFSYSPTSVWHWKSSDSSNSMTGISRKVWKRSSRRVVHRLENLAFYYSPTLSSARLLKPETQSYIDVASNASNKFDLATTPYEHAIDEQDFEEYCILENFHTSELNGVWSNDNVSQITIRLDADVRDQGGVLSLTFMTSYNGEPNRHTHVSVNGGERQTFENNDWSVCTAILPLNGQQPEFLDIKIEVDCLYHKNVANVEVRPLGALVKSIGVYDTVESAEQAIITKFLGPRELTVNDFFTEYYEDGNYRQVELKPAHKCDIKSFCKLQKNGDNFSIEIDIQSLLPLEKVNREYIESDRIPVFRLYFNGHPSDMKARYDLIPKRLKKTLHAAFAADPQIFLADIATENRAKAIDLVSAIRKRIETIA